jgi:hypothetical protein
MYVCMRIWCDLININCIVIIYFGENSSVCLLYFVWLAIVIPCWDALGWIACVYVSTEKTIFYVILWNMYIIIKKYVLLYCCNDSLK